MRAVLHIRLNAARAVKGDSSNPALHPTRALQNDQKEPLLLQLFLLQGLM